MKPVIIISIAVGISVVAVLGIMTFAFSNNYSDSVINTIKNTSRSLNDAKIIIEEEVPKVSEIVSQKAKEAQQTFEKSSEESGKKITEAIKSVPKTSYSQDELLQYALQKINEDRKLAGLEPVSQSNNNAAQIHAEDVLKTRTISHWMTNGEKPYMTYTRLGGTGQVSQNVGISGFPDVEDCKRLFVVCKKIDPFDAIKESEYGMMYDDAASNWGHKDNILRPYHTHVSLGIAYDDYTFVLVQNFEDNYIDFTKRISEVNGIVSFSGTIKEGSLYNISIYYDQIPTPELYQQHKDDKSYQLGEQVTTINKPLSSGTYYKPSSDTFAIADKWVENGDYIDVSFDMSPFVTKAGVYTITVWIENKNDVFTTTSYSIIENKPLVSEDFRSSKVHYACTETQLAQYDELKTKYDELTSQYNKIPQTVTSDQDYQNAMKLYDQLQSLSNQLNSYRC